MTDTTKSEALSDADLDGVQGGMGNFEIQDLTARKTDGSSKGIVLSSESEEPNLKRERDEKGYLIITMEN